MSTHTLDCCEDFAAMIDQLFGNLQASAPRRGPRTEVHHHKCDSTRCGRIWSHAEADFHSSAEWEAGHSCPTCGTKQVFKCTPEGKPL